MSRDRDTGERIPSRAVSRVGEGCRWAETARRMLALDPCGSLSGMDLADVDALLDRHRDRFRRVLQVIAAEEEGEDPFRFPLARYRTLPDDQKVALVRRASIIARERVRREQRARGAAWLVLVGDEVVEASPDPWAIPSPEQVLALGEGRGLVAYLFEAPLIEEVAPSISPWSPLSRGDAYPSS